MRLTIAAYVSTIRDNGRTIHVCQSIRGQHVSARDALLRVGLSKLSSRMRKAINGWIESGKPNLLDPWLYDPSMLAKDVKLTLVLRDRTIRWKILLVTIPLQDRSIAFSPNVPRVAFEVSGASDLDTRATEVYQRYCQSMINEGRADELASVSVEGAAWLEPIDVDVETTVLAKKKSKNILAQLFGNESMRGGTELHKIGQCLDEIVVENDTAIGRVKLVEEIDRLLARPDRPGVLLLGPPAVGKSAIFQQCVKHRAERFRERRGSRPQIWAISPQRLISGMSYLGQWEQRWLAILREATRRDHVLYFDDLVGLFTAGQTRDSRLNAADVLRGYLSEHRVRICGETTAEELAILRRKDRALADTFHLVHVPSLSTDATLPILLEATLDLETRSGNFIHPAVPPLVIRYQDILSPNRAFPGKAIEMVKNLSGPGGTAVDESALIEHIRQRTGTNLLLLLGQLGNQQTIGSMLAWRVVGQPDALRAMARVVTRAARHLQPLDKPMGVLLFLGPTGVGKTESAKALTELLFSDASHMIRIDMNEVTTPLAAEQLIGTFDQPEGRLTAAVRRQPHSVILLDEIEKAHPDVFDYLLQALGEGRLTDARGRIVDFRSSIVIMTSNLGSRDLASGIGFELGESQRNQVALKAAEGFFRPEFMNRIDEIVVFRPLEEADIESIVAIQLQSLLQRDGLLRRDVYLCVEKDAIAQVVSLGFDRRLGARAVRRALEREVVQPVADRLAQIEVRRPVFLRVSRIGNQLHCPALPLDVAVPHSPLEVPELAKLVEAGKRLIENFESRLNDMSQRLREDDSQARMSDQRASYYALHEQVYSCSELLRAAKFRLHSDAEPRLGSVQRPPSAVKRSGNPFRNAGSKRFMRDWISEEDLRDTIDDGDRDKAFLEISSPELGKRLFSGLLVANAMLDAAHTPRQWFVGLEILSKCPWSSPRAASFHNSSDQRLFLHADRGDVVRRFESWLFDCLQGHWQYEVRQDLSFGVYRLVSGVSVIGLIAPILGTYAVERTPRRKDLLMLRAFPVDSTATDDQLRNILQRQAVQDEDGFLPTCREQSLPSTTIRGSIGERLQDYVSGSWMELPSEDASGDGIDADRFRQWWTGCLPLPSGLSPLGSASVPEARESQIRGAP